MLYILNRVIYCVCFIAEMRDDFVLAVVAKVLK